MVVKPQHRAEIVTNGNVGEKTVVPEHYAVRLKAGAQLKEAAKQLTQRQIGGRNE